MSRSSPTCFVLDAHVSAAPIETSGRSVEAPGRTAKIAGWLVDLVSQSLTDPGGDTVELTGNEFQLLVALLTRTHRALSRQEILEVVLGGGGSPSGRSVDVLIAELRRKLADDPRHLRLIKTMRGQGYRLTAPVDFA